MIGSNKKKINIEFKDDMILVGQAYTDINDLYIDLNLNNEVTAYIVGCMAINAWRLRRHSENMEYKQRMLSAWALWKVLEGCLEEELDFIFVVTDKNDEYIGVKTLIGWSDIKKVGRYINDGKMSTENARHVMDAILSECESNGVVLSKLCERDNDRYRIYYDRFTEVPNGSGGEWKYRVKLDSHGTSIGLEKLINSIEFYYIPGATINASMALQRNILDICNRDMTFETMHDGKTEAFNLYDLLIPDPDDINMTVQDTSDYFEVDDITGFKRRVYAVTLGDYISYKRCSSAITDCSKLEFYSDLLITLGNWDNFDFLNSSIITKYMYYLIYYKLDIKSAVRLAEETGGFTLKNVSRQDLYFIGESELMTQTLGVHVVNCIGQVIGLDRLASYDGFTLKENEGEISLLYRVLKRYESEAMKWMNDPCNKWVISKHYKDGLL